MRYARYYFSNYGWIPVDFGAGEEEGGRFESSRERRAIPPWIHSHPHEIQSSQLQRRGGRADEQRRGLCTTRSKPIHITFLDVRCFIYNLFISSSVQPFVFLSLQFVRETESASRQFSLSLFFLFFQTTCISRLEPIPIRSKYSIDFFTKFPLDSDWIYIYIRGNNFAET